MLGEVLLIQPLSHWMLTSIAMSIVMLIAIYLMNGVYPRKATVPGYLVPDKGLIKVYAQRSGVITRIHARKGDTVLQNDPVFTLNMEVGLEQGGDIDSQLLVEIAEQKTGLATRLDHCGQTPASSVISHIAM